MFCERLKSEQSVKNLNDEWAEYYAFSACFSFGTDIAIRLLLTHKKRSKTMKKRETKISAIKYDNENVDWDR